MVECFEATTNQCGLNPQCKLKALLQNATASYLAVLDAVTLEELVTPTRSTVTMPSSKKGFVLLGIPG